MRVFWAATLAVVLMVVMTGTGAQAADPPPGTMIRIDPADLPAPYATASVSNPPRRIERPDDAVPRVPEGFEAQVFAEGLDHARWLAVAPNGDVFVAESAAGKITVLRDSDGDGTADETATFADDFKRPHGLAFARGGLYVADLEAVWRFPYDAGDMTAQGERIQVTPDGALGDHAGHWTRSIAISPNGLNLYVAIGSRSNIAVEAPPRATIQLFDLENGGTKATKQRTFASGLRNPVGLAFRPGTAELWTVVNERDGMGDELVPDYLAHVEEGQFYGWPYAYIGPNPQPRLAELAPAKVAETEVPEVLFRAHSAALGLVFYDGATFPEGMQGDAFVGLHGSWNAGEPRGYAVARVPFENGKPTGEYELFATGFWVSGTERAEVWGRPVGVAVARDGALLVADDVSQTVWRIAVKEASPAE